MENETFDEQEVLMDTTTKEIAAVLRSTDSMAEQFVKQIQERVGKEVSHAEILAVMQQMSPKRLSMSNVVAKIQQKQS
jgi:hypothetical protein